MVLTTLLYNTRLLQWRSLCLEIERTAKYLCMTSTDTCETNVKDTVSFLQSYLVLWTWLLLISRARFTVTTVSYCNMLLLFFRKSDFHLFSPFHIVLLSALVANKEDKEDINSNRRS